MSLAEVINKRTFQEEFPQKQIIVSLTLEYRPLQRLLQRSNHGPQELLLPYSLWTGKVTAKQYQPFLHSDSLMKLLPTLGRALQLTLILIVLIAILIKLKYTNKPPRDLPWRATFPFRYNISADPDTVPWDQDFGPYNVLLEMHSHTYFSDGSMSPEQLVEWAIAYGFTAVVVSDHNDIRGGLRAKQYAEENGYDKNTMLVIPAVEYTYISPSSVGG